MHRGLADHFEQLRARFRPHDRLIGGAEGCEHARHSLHRPLGIAPLLFVLEIAEPKRNVGRHARQHRDAFCQRAGAAPVDHQRADAAAIAGQRQRRGRADARLAHLFPPCPGARVVDQIMADGRSLIAKGFTGKPHHLRGRLRDGNIDRAQPLGQFAGTGGKAERIGSRFQYVDCRRQEIAENRGFADLLVQLLRRFGIEDRFVGCAQRLKRVGNIGNQNDRSPGGMLPSSTVGAGT